MKDQMNKRLARYKELAERHGQGTLDSNASKTNRAHHKLHDVFIALVARQEDHLLFDLYEDSDPSVRIWAAAHTLEMDEDRALATLQKVSDTVDSILGSTAYYTIEEWKYGNLFFRPD